LLGPDYSEWVIYPLQIATDGSGAPFLIAGASQINFQADSSPLTLLVEPQHQALYSNSFRIYVAAH
jgi:hypothetical protein